MTHNDTSSIISTAIKDLQHDVYEVAAPIVMWERLGIYACAVCLTEWKQLSWFCVSDSGEIAQSGMQRKNRFFLCMPDCAYPHNVIHS